jgi:hypothetical protein
MDLHFPIALLASRRGEDGLTHRGNLICAYAADSRGRGMMAQDGFEEHDLFAKLEKSPTLKTVLDQLVDDENGEHNPVHLAWAAGCLNGIYFKLLSDHLKCLEGSKSFISRLERAAGTRSPFVRIPGQFADEAFGWCNANGNMTYREFSILCAVYSCIGDKEVSVVRRSQIRDRAFGVWNTKVKAFAVEDSLTASPQDLTDNQLRYTLDELEGRKLLHRLRDPNRRDAWFSRHHNPMEMVALVLPKRKAASGWRVGKKFAESQLRAALKPKAGAVQ